MSTPPDDGLSLRNIAGDDGPPYVGALLRQCLEHVRARMEADIKAAGFTDLQPALFAVFTFPPPEGMRPSDFARRIRMSRQATNHIIGQLETLGYVERRAQPEGGRRRIHLTPRTWEVVKVIHSTLLQIQAEWGAEIGQDRFVDFMATLRRFADRGCKAG
jgi:DNA-binding MarR family transcriptional regulator